MEPQGAHDFSGRRRARHLGPVVAAALVALAASACGTASGSPGASGPGTRLPSAAHVGNTPGVDATDEPTWMPFEPTPAPAFGARAKRLVEKLRSSGALERHASTLTLLSTRIVEPDFADESLERAFAGYEFRAGTRVSGAASPGAVTFADGSTRTVDLVSARALLDDLIEHGIGCRDGEPCPVVTRATLGTATRMTTRGPATVPVWQYWADGLDEPYQVVAATRASLPDLPLTFAFEDYFRDGLGAEWARVDGDRGVIVGVSHGSCAVGPASHVLELPDVVVVGGSEGEFRGGCTADAKVTPSAIPLAKPLALRPVVDVNTGRFLAERM